MRGRGIMTTQMRDGCAADGVPYANRTIVAHHCQKAATSGIYRIVNHILIDIQAAIGGFVWESPICSDVRRRPRERVIDERSTCVTRREILHQDATSLRDTDASCAPSHAYTGASTLSSWLPTHVLL